MQTKVRTKKRFKHLLILVFLLIFILAGTGMGQVYKAREFPVINAGEVPYYKDGNRDALAIDAANTSYRDKFAKAVMTYNGDSGIFDVIITTLTEEDGESSYRLYIAGTQVGDEYQNPRVDKAGDSQPNLHTWEMITINQGDEIAIESNTHSNEILPEGSGFAWARGRWRQIELAGSIPADDPIDSSDHQQDDTGLLVIEAENFDNQELKDQSNWFVISDPTASRGQALASEDSGINHNQDDYADVAPRVDYNCTFVKSGTHYVWLRMSYSGGDSDTAHLGINGVGDPDSRRIDAPGSAEDAWQWSNVKQNPDGTAMIDIPSEGEHVVNLWVREDGIRIDKILLTNDPNYVPEGYGPRDQTLGPAITLESSEDLVATGDFGTILSIDGIEVNDLILGTTTFAGEPKWADQLPEYADNFDLNSDASADDQAYIQTMFDLPVTTVYLVERGDGDPGMIVPLDTMGVPMDDPLPFTKDTFGGLPYKAYGNQGSMLMVITPEAQIGGILILPPEDSNLGIDPASISGVPGSVAVVAPISGLEVDDPNDDDPNTPIVATAIDGMSTSDLILGVTTANPDNQQRADNFNVDPDSDYARRQPDTNYVITMFDVSVTAVYVLEKDGNDGGYVQPLDGDGLPIGAPVSFTADDFLKTETSGWAVGGMAVLPKAPIQGIQIWSTGIDVLSISGVPIPLVSKAAIDTLVADVNAVATEINGIATADLILGTTVAHENLERAANADSFDLANQDAGREQDENGDSRWVTTTFDQPVTQFFVFDMAGSGGNADDDGWVVPLDIDGNSIGGVLWYYPEDWGTFDIPGARNDRIVAGLVFTPETDVPVYGLLQWSDGVDILSISAVPAP